MSQQRLRLGTRRSALARAQSSQVARQLESLHPGLVVESVGIDTRGDRILDTPLSQVEGKEFFTAEIDAALLRRDVDLTVHSFKDLSLERPAAFCLAAVPERENPRDIALFAPDIMVRIAAGAALRVGTSSPRRAAFAPGFLRRALPGAAVVELVELRGNVDSRLRRLLEPLSSARRLDGIVLAFAGLARLWLDDDGRALLQQLMVGLPRMLLPLTMCPAAPAQGALAIECRSDDTRTRQILAAIEHAPTRTAVAVEREMLAARGGGCHQQFGATQLTVPGLGSLLRWREAEESAAQSQAQLQWSPETPLPAPGRVSGHWDGSASPAAEPAPIAGMAQRCADALARARGAFIVHRHALPKFDADLSSDHVNRCPHIWVPGTATWFALAQRGIWVEGCAEGLGFDSLQSTLNAPLLQLPSSPDWLVLTHEAAASGWHGTNVLTTYRSRAAQGAAPHGASHVFWHSAAQFEHWRESLSPEVHHACAFGKTVLHLRRAGVATLTVFPSALEWRQWLIS